jgi:succinoglycan biosynthesis transport protein ExoP
MPARDAAGGASPRRSRRGLVSEWAGVDEPTLPTRPRPAPHDEWLSPPREEEGLSRYIETLRERMWVVLIAVAITTGIAIAYVVVATKTYEAQADILVTPVSSQNTPFIGLPLIFESTDPTRDVETAARLVTTPEVANRVRDKLGITETATSLLDDVSAEPIAQSNLVAVTASADSATGAQDLANSFAEQAVDNRTDVLHQAIDRLLPQLRAQAASEPGANASLDSEVTALSTLRRSPDPTMRVTTLAELPTGPSSPRRALSVAAGLFAGLVLGIAAAFALQALDPRLRREEQLRRLYRLPILARIPKEPRAPDGAPLPPESLSVSASEAYRTLRGTLVAAARESGEEGHAILVTGSSPGEGKTTTAINLATSLAAAGKRVIVVEADLRRPAIGRAFGIRPEQGIVSVLIESVALTDAIANTNTYGANLGLLLADYEGGWVTELFALPAAREMLAEAKRIADYVIVDSPPLADVVDALPLVDYVDDVLVVVRLGTTQLSQLSQLGELLADRGTRPAGFAVVGTSRPPRDDTRYRLERHRRVPRGSASVAAIGSNLRK